MFGPKFLADPASEPLLDEWQRQLKRSPRAGISRAVMGVADRQPDIVTRHLRDFLASVTGSSAG